MFCCELESIDHLFFECLVSSTIWKVVSDFFGTNLGSDYMSIARFWVTNKSHSALNAICAAVLWSIWKHRNALIFDGLTWLSMKQIWWLILRTIKKWWLLFKQSMLEKIDQFVLMVTDIVMATPAALSFWRPRPCRCLRLHQASQGRCCIARRCLIAGGSLCRRLRCC